MEPFSGLVGSVLCSHNSKKTFLIIINIWNRSAYFIYFNHYTFSGLFVIFDHINVF